MSHMFGPSCDDHVIYVTENSRLVFGCRVATKINLLVTRSYTMARSDIRDTFEYTHHTSLRRQMPETPSIDENVIGLTLGCASNACARTDEGSRRCPRVDAPWCTGSSLSQPRSCRRYPGTGGEYRTPRDAFQGAFHIITRKNT